MSTGDIFQISLRMIPYIINFILQLLTLYFMIKKLDREFAYVKIEINTSDLMKIKEK